MRPSITQGTRLNSRGIKSLGAVLFFCDVYSVIIRRPRRRVGVVK